MKLLSALLVVASSIRCCGATTTIESCSEQDRKSHPILCSMVDHLLEDPNTVAKELHNWAKTHGLLVGGESEATTTTTTAVQRNLRRDSSSEENDASSSSMPVVFAHGMGDSCFNSGFQGIVKHTSEMLGDVYSVCIPTGKSQSEDTTNGYFLNMDASADVFAKGVADDPKLANGFHAIGFSQGNNVIRGYIAKYNTPAVHTFISVNGVNGGEGAVPYCEPSHLYNEEEATSATTTPLEFSMCDLLMEQASRAAYTEYAQQHSFQANYWRDPRPVEFPTYQKMCQLAAWNNEGINGVNETLKENFAKTQQFVWILATKDGMVWPKEGEQWGAPDPQDPFQHILPREETDWYINDLFGLRTAEEAGKNAYESFDGDHLQFSMDDFDGWINKYLA